MRFVIGAAIGVVVGLAAGILGFAFWGTIRPDTSSIASTASYVCQWDAGTRQSALVIKGDRTGAKEIIFPWRTDGDRWRIDKTTDMNYFATNIEEKRSRISISTIDLNRVTGELQVVDRYTPEALKIVAGACNKTIPDCNNKMKQIGGDDFSCFVLQDECPRFLEGNNFKMRGLYTCRSAERRF